MNRWRILLFTFAVSAVSTVPAFAADGITDGKLNYRGFAVEISAVQTAWNFAAIGASVKHQIDIVADCGAKEEILTFFRSHLITLDTNIFGDDGRFNDDGLAIGSSPESAEKPILLHELLHAYHAQVMPMGVQNPDVLLYYDRARNFALYPANEYLLTNQKEFFAVTASLYLWGHVSRVPFTRDKLKAQQPNYYAWLGRQFGVQK
jgi:hypothetical protein